MPARTLHARVQYRPARRANHAHKPWVIAFHLLSFSTAVVYYHFYIMLIPFDPNVKDSTPCTRFTVRLL